MEILAMIFAIFMIAAAVATTVVIGWATGFWGGLGFAVFLILLYRAAIYESGPPRPMRRNQLNAFQQPLAEDDDRH